MKAPVAFAIGLWTGALAIGAVGLFYFSMWNHGRVVAVSPTPDQTEPRIQLLEQQNAQSTAEVLRLRQTVAELQGRLAAQGTPPFPGAGDQALRPARRIPFRQPGAPAAVAPWIVQSVVDADPQALPKLEQAALQNDMNALDAIALLADRDNADTLTRVWASQALTAGGRDRATMLLAATVELNPHGEELLQPLAVTAPGGESLLPAALEGLETPGFQTRLTAETGVPGPPRFKPDYALRLRILDNWRSAVTDETLAASMDKIRAKLTQRAAEPETAGQ